MCKRVNLIFRIDKLRVYQFRISAHQIAIEKGRYKKIDKDKRFCWQGKIMQVKDAFHFLIECIACETEGTSFYSG